MTLESAVNLALLEYPSIYLCETYKDSRILVLEHLFLVLGNGYDWAKTQDKSEGGYLIRIEDLQKTKSKFDPPYNSQTVTKKSQSYLLKNYYKHEKDLLKKSEFYTNTYKEELLKYLEQEESVNKYPNEINLGSKGSLRIRNELYPFSWRYSHIKSADLEYLKPDWKVGMIEIVDYALNYFENISKDKNRSTVIKDLKKAEAKLK
jgi:hypothetical protein